MYLFYSQQSINSIVTNLYEMKDGSYKEGQFLLQTLQTYGIGWSDLVLIGEVMLPFNIIKYNIYNVNSKSPHHNFTIKISPNQINNINQIKQKFIVKDFDPFKIINFKPPCQHPAHSLYVSGYNGKQGCYKCGTDDITK